MKKILSLVLVLLMGITTFTSCGASLKLPDEYNYDDLAEYIKLGEYKGIEYDKIEVTVTRHQIEAELDELLESAKESKQYDEGKVTEDCTANIDYVGSIDGVEFDGGAAEGTDLDIDNSNFIDGFAEGLIGHKVGENFDINVTFPDDYGSEDLAGKDAVFNITVNYITKEVYPEYNDEFVKNNTDYDTTEELEAAIEKQLYDEQLEDAEKETRANIFSEFLDASEVIEYPETELESKKTKLAESFKTKAENSGTDISTYITQTLGMTEDEFNEEIENSTKTTVKMELVLYQIARLEGIELTAQDYMDYVDQLVADSGYTAESFEEANGVTPYEFAAANDLFTSLLYQKVMDKVMEYSVEK